MIHKIVETLQIRENYSWPGVAERSGSKLWLPGPADTLLGATAARMGIS